MKDRDSPFLKPLWRRIVLVAFCAVWAAWEWWNAEMFWAALVAAIAVYGAWTFLIDYDRRPAADAGRQSDEQP
jgi:hypothetical protein